VVQKIQGSQFDFSSGEFDPEVKRDGVVAKTGGRQCFNFRILNSKVLSNRAGRSLLFVQGGRTEEVLVAPGTIYRLCFGGDGSLVIRDHSGAVVASQPAATYAWRTATLQQICWDKVKIGAAQIDVIICFPGQEMQVASFSGTAWTFPAFSFQLDGVGVPLFPYFRIAAPGITMQPSDISGSVTVTFSAPVLLPAHVGAIFRYAVFNSVGRRLQITAVTSPTVGTATWLEVGIISQLLNLTTPVSSGFNVGDVVNGQSTGVTSVVTEVIPTGQIVVQILNSIESGYQVGEVVTGPNQQATTSAVTNQSPQPITVWDEQLCSNARGWPQSVFADQDRLGFCNFPGVPTAIAWSSEGLPYDFNVGPNPTDAMVEVAPFNSQVLFVVPGPESSEFVFCDRAIFYIAISATNPLKPGSVGFQVVSNDGTAAFVQPRAVQEVIIYVDSALVSVRSIVATGAFNRPYETRALSDLHTHLIKSPIAIAVPSASIGFPERYGFILNSDGTVAVFKYQQQAGQLQGTIGWTPWSGRGTVQFIGALGGNVLFSSTYGGVSVVETMDVTRYLDTAFLVNNPPAALTPPGGKGPLWFAPSAAVTLMDLGTRQMGIYQVDANGFIIPQFIGGENLLSAQLVAGHDWTAIFEPFVPDANSGTDVGQRMFRRRVARLAVYAMNSTGYLMARLFSGPLTPTSPALGTIMNSYRVTTYNQGDDPTQPPPLREGTERSRPIGRSYDPRVAVIKDTPGPLIIAEVGMEVTI
jgi:hypothetical protein